MYAARGAADFFNGLTLPVATDDDGRHDGGDCTDADGEIHCGGMRIDATCTDAEVRFPTDINFPEGGCSEVDRLTHKHCDRLDTPSDAERAAPIGIDGVDQPLAQTPKPQQRKQVTTDTLHQSRQGDP